MKVLKKMGERLCEGEKHKNHYLKMKQTLRKTLTELKAELPGVTMNRDFVILGSLCK